MPRYRSTGSRTMKGFVEVLNIRKEESEERSPRAVISRTEEGCVFFKVR
jgi:hypothetical protein